MHKTIKKAVCILLSATMIISLSACSNSKGTQNSTNATMGSSSSTADSNTSGGSGEKVTISFYSWWADAEQEMGNALIDAFEKKYPNINVEPTYIAQSDYLSKLNTLVAADTLPDVYYLNEYLINDWGSSGVSADLTSEFKKMNINPEDKWIDTALYKSGDALYGINYGSTTIVLYYNKDMLKAAGIEAPGTDATKPWTWDEYVNAAIAMTKDVNGKGPKDSGFDYNSCTQFGTTMTNSWIYWLPLLYSGGASIANDAGDALNITSDAAINTLQSIADLSLVHQCAPTAGVMDSAFSDTSAMLMNGQLGMFIGGTFLLGNFTKEKFDVGITQIPTSNGAAASNMVWSAAYSMSAKTEHPDEAALFLDFMADFDNTVQVSLDTGVGIGTLPSTKTTLDPSSEQYTNWNKAYDPTMAEVSSGILTDASRVGENVTLKNFSTIMDETLVPAMDLVWLGSKSAKDTMAEVEDTLKTKLEGSWK